MHLLTATNPLEPDDFENVRHHSMNRTIGIFAALLVVSFSASAQQPALHGPLLDHMIGSWVLQGTIDGKETTHDIDAEWVLNSGYLRLHEVSREMNSSGGPAYEAIVFISWDQRSSEYSCLWLDSTGNGGLSASAVGRGKPSGDKIPIVFKAVSGDRFYTTFIYSQSTDTWQWAMDSEEGGKLQPFARVRLTKK
jgi:hypothetical protein